MLKKGRWWSTSLLCFSFILIFLSHGVHAASSLPQTPAGSIHTDIYSAEIISDELLIMMGYRGKIFRPEDGYKNWTDIPSVTQSVTPFIASRK